ncbi:MAG: hypothetical protein AAF918_15925 [Pseudomonadota bacterium]
MEFKLWNIKLEPKVQVAFAIGFLVGIVIYSIFANAFGLLMLIPLYLAYRLYCGSKRKNS